MKQSNKVVSWDYEGLKNTGIFSPTYAVSLLIVFSFWFCDGQAWQDSKGWHARAYANHRSKLEPLMGLPGSKIGPIRGKKRLVWSNDRKATVQWLKTSIEAAFKRKPSPPPKGVCPHCYGEEGRHDPECYTGGGAD